MWGRLAVLAVLDHQVYRSTNPSFRASLAQRLALSEAALVSAMMPRRTSSAPAASQRARVSVVVSLSIAKDPHWATLSTASSVVLCWAHFSKTSTTTAPRQTRERIRGEGLNNDGWCDRGSQGSGWGTFIYVCRIRCKSGVCKMVFGSRECLAS